MAEREISRSDFITACCTVAAVLANGAWQKLGFAHGPVKEGVPAGATAAMDLQTAAKFCGFGRTRFRELVDSGVFPQPVMIEGRKRWLAKDLQAALGQMSQGHSDRNKLRNRPI
jgi:predicted DNA-binding transcriptional regulator AlpA